MAAWGSHNTTGNKPASQTSRSTHFPAPINPENTPKSIPGTTGINHTVPHRTTRSTLPKQHQPVKPTNPHTSRHRSSRKHPERRTPETIKSITPPLTRRPDQHYPKQQPGTNPEPSSQQPETTPPPDTCNRHQTAEQPRTINRTARRTLPHTHPPRNTGPVWLSPPASAPAHTATRGLFRAPWRTVSGRTSRRLDPDLSPGRVRPEEVPSLRRLVLSEPPTSTRSRRRQASPGVYPPTTVR
ncbi:Uncharacterised protein [Acidipropionibacterium jensenii]|uniref:Uncharacterized protein n=1 Tax=Acidipropionibacterium jensenii TaxID=1749 RepID=A0A3S5EV54_9ACTN|nr:Uncharacterised protein [Acidipropionibacterium jensenii]